MRSLTIGFEHFYLDAGVEMVKKIAKHFITKLNMVRAFRNNSELMCKGHYRFDDTMSFICLNENETMEQSRKLLNNILFVISTKKTNSLLLNTYNALLGVLFYSLLTVKNSNRTTTDFGGTIFLMTSNKIDFIIFDLVRSKVLRKYSLIEDLRKKTSQYDYFSQYFPIPEITHRNFDDKVIIEAYIESKNRNDWTEIDFISVINDIFKIYTDYFKQTFNATSQDYIIPKALPEYADKNNILIQGIIENTKDSILDAEFPVAFLHGDLWSSNVLIDRNGAKYYIDWECSKRFVFFYDIFYFMWNEFYMKDERFYLDRYFEGNLDISFGNLFGVYGLKYENALRIDYFNIFLLAYYHERGAQFGSGKYFEQLNNIFIEFNTKYRNVAE